MATPLSSVKVVDVCRVVPPPTRPDSAAPKSLPLTFFDILWLRFPPVQRLFLYEFETTKPLFYDTIFPKLKHSLSLTLHHYLPLAGNLIWPENSPKPVINYLDGDGVSFTVAKSEGQDFCRLTADGIFPEAAECHPLIPQLASSCERAQVVALQVTLFPGSGFCVGISSHHAILDGKTSTSFVKSWARICRSLGEFVTDETLYSDISAIIDRPFYERTVVKDQAGLEKIYTSAWLNEDGPENRSVKAWEFNLPQGLVRGTFELTREKIEKLRKSMEAKNPAVSPPLHVSAFSLACSYTSVCVAKALGRTRDENHRRACIALTADLRARLKPEVPMAYFGNCVGGRAAVVEAEALFGEDGVSRALEAISRAVKSLDDDDVLKGSENLASIIIDGAKSRAVGDVYDGDPEKIKVKKKNSAVTVISFSGSPRFEVYSTDFGFGRPKKVEMSSIDRTGAICLSDSKNGNGGVEIGLVLKRKEMEAFASEFVKGL